MVRADSFGRYGYDAGPGIPDILVSRTGLVADRMGASHLDFAAPVANYVVQSTHATAQVCLINGPEGCPRKIRSSLVGNSVDLYFGNGISLICRSKEAPFLSWTESTVGHDVPTPSLKWFLLSFSTAEPPYLFGFEGDKVSLEVTGTPGNWAIKAPNFVGWMRVWLPYGIDPKFGTDASSLGQMSTEVSKFSWLWESRTPTVSKVLVKGDDLAVDATWKFDGPGAFIPQAPQLAQLGGSSLSIVSPFEQLPGEGTTGPNTFLKSDEMTIHFPTRKISIGRAVGIGNADKSTPTKGVVSNPPGIVALACQSLVASDDGSLVKLADDTVTRFLVEATYSLEPNTKQQLPFAADGTGLELAAAHAFLAESAMLAEGSVQPNALYDSILWRRDWWTWMIPAADQDVSRRATALTALAGALSSDPVDRMYAATLEAGLEAQKGEQIYRERKFKDKPAKPLVEPMLGLREGIYALKRPKVSDLAFYDLLQSPLKVADGSVVEADKCDTGWLLNWRTKDGKGAIIKMFCPDDVQVALSANLKSAALKKDPTCQILSYVPIAAGVCSAKFSGVSALPSLPISAPPPSY